MIVVTSHFLHPCLINWSYFLLICIYFPPRMSAHFSCMSLLNIAFSTCVLYMVQCQYLYFCSVQPSTTSVPSSLPTALIRQAN